ncbi:MAG: hypothetical protein ACLURV_10500 [Gallintestinimicrobium sp.]
MSLSDEYLDDLTDFTGNVRDYTLGELKAAMRAENGRKSTASSQFRPLRILRMGIRQFADYNVEIKSSVYYYEGWRKRRWS